MTRHEIEWIKEYVEAAIARARYGKQEDLDRFLEADAMLNSLATPENK